MVQVKKPLVRTAILRSAKSLFKSRGYAGTSMTQIAKKARISTANLYNYYDSKLEIFFAIYSEWLSMFITELERAAHATADPRTRLEIILRGLWKDLPEKDNGFSNNLIQALSTKSPREHYSRRLLMDSEARIYTLLQECLELQGRSLKADLLPHLLFMAMDGFVMNQHLDPDAGEIDKIVGLMSDLLLRES